MWPLSPGAVARGKYGWALAPPHRPVGAFWCIWRPQTSNDFRRQTAPLATSLTSGATDRARPRVTFLTSGVTCTNMCSIVVACALIPRFALLAALGERRELLAQAVALAPEPGGPQVVGEV